MNKNTFNRSKSIISSVANATVTRDNSGSTLDNNGATGVVVVTVADAQFGDFYDIDVVAAQSFKISAGANGVFVLAGTSGTVGNKLINNGTAGDTCQIVCVGAGPTFRVRGPGATAGDWSTGV